MLHSSATARRLCETENVFSETAAYLGQSFLDRAQKWLRKNLGSKIQHLGF